MRKLEFALFFWCLAPVAVSAATWPGYLVDANCYESEQHNVNKFGSSSADRDVTAEVRDCRPTVNTKFFGVVGDDTQMTRLDPSGNAKVVEFVRQNAGMKDSLLPVTVTGDKLKGRLQVDSIASGR